MISLQDPFTLFLGDRLDLLKQIPDGEAQLVVTSPPYNIGKKYENKTSLDNYLKDQQDTLEECYRILSDHGSLCWQVGNYIVGKGEILPLDIPIHNICSNLGLHLRNRVIWHFGHGLHNKNRFSGRYEVIMWYTKSDDYVFNLDPVRVPQKYPNKKHFRGNKKGEYSCNPKGKNPSDVWDIPNVKHNHCEKTIHPCQFPIGLIERLVLSMTNPQDLIVDPYMGVGTSLCAALIHNRRAAGAEKDQEYYQIALDRTQSAMNGTLKIRPFNKPIFENSQTVVV